MHSRNADSGITPTQVDASANEIECRVPSSGISVLALTSQQGQLRPEFLGTPTTS
jgi:hypothetical protein